MKIYNIEGNLIPDVEDVLYELGNVGTGMVSVTVGQMLEVRISITTPKVTSLESKLPKTLDMNPGEDAVAIYMNMKDAITGDVVFVLDKDFIVSVVGKLTGENYTFETMMDDDCGFSAAKEFGNIMGSAYIKAIGGYTGIRLYLSPVMVGVDKVGNLMSSAYLNSLEHNERQIYVESEFSIVDENGNKFGQQGHIIMMPDESSVESLMEAIGL